MKEINTRCPFQSECGQNCKYQHHERDCSYYRANSRPDSEIEDQEQAIQAEWEKRMDEPSVLADAPAAEPPQEAAGQADVLPPITGMMTKLPVSSLHPHPDNPRKDLGDLTELSASIKANGVFQNLTVVPIDEDYTDFTVIIGHRRLAAAKMAGLLEVPCVITQMTMKEQLQTMLLENMQRSELTPYEQAQGFQMMLNLGSTVEEISEKSGFSVSTVRRRVKMMELDQDILKEVSERQLSLTDFDKLAQIEDIAARNECLSKIGTADFNGAVIYKLRKQDIQKKMPLIMESLNKLNAKPIPKNERYSSKYATIEYLHICDWREGSPVLTKKVNGQLFYHIEEYSDCIVLFEKSKRAEPVRRTAEEIEREKQIAEAWSMLDEKSAVAYDLRSAFVKGVSCGKRNVEQVLRGALIVGTVRAIAYYRTDEESFRNILGLDDSCWAGERAAQAVDVLRGMDEKQIPALIYALFGDSAKEGWCDSYRKAYPEYKASARLKGLYDWLTGLGYEMSDEEKSLLDGSHELFHRKEIAK